MRTVVLDANALNPLRPLHGNALRLLLEAAEGGEFVLVVPELALLEALHRWRRGVDDELGKIEASRKLLAERGVEVSVDTRHDDVEAQVRDRLAQVGAVIPALPETPHSELVTRALARRQPFSRAGKDGYRDALLWETVIEVGSQATELFVVSSDTAAFAISKDDKRLSLDLKAEFRERAGWTPIELFIGVDAAVAGLLARSEEQVQGLRDALGDPGFRKMFDRRVTEALREAPVDAQDAGRAFGVHVLRAKVFLALDAQALAVTYGRVAANHDLLFRLQATVRCLITMQLPSDELADAMVRLPVEGASVYDEAVAGINISALLDVEFDGAINETDDIQTLEPVRVTAARPTP